MSHHIISGRDITTQRAVPINASNNNLKVIQDYPKLEINHIVDNVVIGAGATHTTSAIEFRQRHKLLIFGTSNQNNVNIQFEISPETTSPSNFFETYEGVDVNTGVVYSFVNLFTDYFRLKITNNEASPTTVNLFATSKI
tara:strand:- start:336 stop:755 length:420 start_codon:yes stop_codon:yes gene_type:complete